MFHNVGWKIKILAQICAWIGIVASIVIGGLFMSKGGSVNAWFGFSVAAVGMLVFWISSLLLYGFGQLIENTDELVQSLDKKGR